jgi:hypothetical protein
MSFINLKQLKSGAVNHLRNAALGKVNDNIPGNIGYGKDGFSFSGNFNQLLQKRQRRWRNSGPLQALYESNGGKVARPIVFPKDIGDEHYMTFHVMDRKRPSKDSVMNYRAFKSITLPIPSNLTNQHGVSYNNENLQVLGALASGQTTFNKMHKGATDVVDLIGKKFNTAHEMFKGMKVSSSEEEKLRTKGQLGGAASISALTALASSKFGGLAAIAGLGGLAQVIQGAGKAEGIAVNPHTAVLFDNVNFREFGFQYKFIARNAEESEDIKSIITTFQYAMHPSTQWGAGGFWEYPDEFAIEFSDKLSRNLFKVNRCVLKGITVNYNGENMPVFFEDTGAPVSIEISLQFQETELLTKEKLGPSQIADDYLWDKGMDNLASNGLDH